VAPSIKSGDVVITKTDPDPLFLITNNFPGPKVEDNGRVILNEPDVQSTK
jgi:hypothetical protein